MSPARPGLLLAGVLLLAVGLLAGGCGSPDDETARPTRTTTAAPVLPSDLPELPVGHGKVRPGDEVRPRGTNLLVNGRKVRLAPLRADAVAVVPGGVFFLNEGELWFTDLAQARSTGYDDVTGLFAAEDGSRIGFVDLGHGPKDDHGTPLALAVAYDARTGKVLRATYEGMGDPATDDLAARYAKSPPAVLGFDDGGMIVRGVDGVRRIPLDGSDA